MPRVYAKWSKLPPLKKDTRFGSWVTERDQLPSEGVRDSIPCVCDCGTRKMVFLRHLREGRSESCGCDRSSITKHGLSTTLEYKSWTAMMQRCYNKDAKGYDAYGGRGIRVCERWKTFELFAKDMGPRPPGLTIDRMDNEAGYDCGRCADCIIRGITVTNCRWATIVEQNSNKRSNVTLTYRGETHTQSEWGRITGMGSQRIQSRLAAGWSVERAISEPVDPMGGQFGRRGKS